MDANTPALLNSVIESIESLNTMILQSKPWLLIQSFVAPFMGTMIGSGLAFGTNYLAQWYANKRRARKRRELHIRLLNAAFLGLNNNIIRLLEFKGDILYPFSKRLKSYLQNEDSNMQKESAEFSLQFMLLPVQIFDETDYTQKLSFVGNEVPIFLDPIRRVREHFFVINYYIKDFNQLMIEEKEIYAQYTEKSKDNMGSNEKPARKPDITLVQYYEKMLIETTDSALWFLEFSIICLKKFAKRFFPKEIIMFDRIQTRHEQLMPKYSYHQEYAENIEQQDIDSKKKKK